MKKEISPREGLRLINTGPVVMVSCGPKDKPNAITLAWSMVVSAVPPMVAVSIAPPRYSHELILRGGDFCVNVPGSDLLKAVMYMGSHSGRDGDKFGPAGLTSATAAAVDTVSIAECPGHLECTVRQAVTAGDHTVFIGEVKAAFADEDCFFNKRWALIEDRGKTLHHLGDDYFGVLERMIKAE